MGPAPGTPLRQTEASVLMQSMPGGQGVVSLRNTAGRAYHRGLERPRMTPPQSPTQTWAPAHASRTIMCNDGAHIARAPCSGVGPLPVLSIKVIQPATTPLS